MRTGLVGFCVLLLAGSARAQVPPMQAAAAPKPGAIGGRVLLAHGVPATSCRVTVEGASGSSGCNTSGAFIVKDVPPGQYDVVISVSGVGETRLSAGAGSDQTTYLGDVTVGVPGVITGKVTANNSADIDLSVIGIPELGVYAQPNITGGYVLTGVPVGTWKVTLFPPGQSASVQSVTLTRASPVVKADFQIKTPASSTPPLVP
jgi:hypothetical protein